MVALQNWINQAREHWKEFQPTRFKALKASGKLEETLRDAAELTALEMSELRAMGYYEQEAWEVVRESYLFPPEEGSNSQRRDSPLWKPDGANVTDSLHTAIKSGVRTVKMQHPGTFTAADLKKAFKGE